VQIAASAWDGTITHRAPHRPSPGRREGPPGGHPRHQPGGPTTP